MALNVPTAGQYEVDDVIADNIANLVGEITKEGFDIDESDIQYEFLSRVEGLYIKSEKLYGEADLPNNFGVHRGYSGGGIHSNLQVTEIDRLPKSRQAKAQRILNLFTKYFWQILKDIDSVTEANEGEELEEWERQTL